MISFKKNKERKRLNKVALRLFILLVFITLVLRVIISILLDLGFYKNQFHPGFFNDPQATFASDYKAFLDKNPRGTWDQFLDSNLYLNNLVRMHPHLLWNLTQFTWITTLFLLLVLIFRYLALKEKIPKSLKWLSCYETFTLVTMYEVVIMIVYWSWIFRHGLLMDPISVIETVNSIIVHAIMPVLIVIYATIYGLYNEKAMLLKWRFSLYGMIYPVGYFLYYIIIALIWNDPYPISQIQSYVYKLQIETLPRKEWYETLYIAPLSLFGIYFSLVIFMLTHNFILKKWNANFTKMATIKKR